MTRNFARELITVRAQIGEAWAQEHSVEESVHSIPIADFDSGEKKRVGMRFR